MDNAPDTIRMAVGIKTAHTFTIKQLFKKLCQKTCDGGCNRLGPYIDVLRLTRTCLCVGGLPRCMGSCSVVRQIAQRKLGLEQADLPGLTALPPMTGDDHVSYSTSRNYLDMIAACYDISQADALFPLLEKSESGNGVATNELPRPDSYWWCTAVFAPWSSKSGSHAEVGVFCDLCKQSDMAISASKEAQLRSLFMVYSRRRRGVEPNLTLIPFCTIEGLVEHMRKVHSQ